MNWGDVSSLLDLSLVKRCKIYIHRDIDFTLCRMRCERNICTNINIQMKY